MIIISKLSGDKYNFIATITEHLFTIKWTDFEAIPDCNFECVWYEIFFVVFDSWIYRVKYVSEI